MTLLKPFAALVFALALAVPAHAAMPTHPALKVTTLDGKTFDLAAQRGKWVIVNYWATWCPPCLEEVPDLVALYDSRKDKDVMVIGVVFDYDSEQTVARYVDDMLMSYPIVYGDDNVVKQIGRADALPTSYIYNPAGALVKVKRGIVSKPYLESLIDARPKE